MTPAERDEFEERAGILEFDAKMTREAAEMMAMRLILEKRQLKRNRALALILWRRTLE